MSAVKTCEPAFPAPEAARSHFGDPAVYMGMTLRDYFAAKAMQGFMLDVDRQLIETGEDPDAMLAEIAKCSYEFADAMLKERAK